MISAFLKAEGRAAISMPVLAVWLGVLGLSGAYLPANGSEIYGTDTQHETGMSLRDQPLPGVRVVEAGIEQRANIGRWIWTGYNWVWHDAEERRADQMITASTTPDAAFEEPANPVEERSLQSEPSEGRWYIWRQTSERGSGYWEPYDRSASISDAELDYTAEIEQAIAQSQPIREQMASPRAVSHMIELELRRSLERTYVWEPLDDNGLGRWVLYDQHMARHTEMARNESPATSDVMGDEMTTAAIAERAPAIAKQNNTHRQHISGKSSRALIEGQWELQNGRWVYMDTAPTKTAPNRQPKWVKRNDVWMFDVT
jgi:hypothetical protein